MPRSGWDFCSEREGTWRLPRPTVDGTLLRSAREKVLFESRAPSRPLREFKLVQHANLRAAQTH
jgi:hypothetical protein